MSNEAMQQYKENQRKFVQSIQNVENLLMVLHQSINKMVGTDKFWTTTAYTHVREGMLALMAAVSKEPNEEELEAFKKAVAEQADKQENPQPETAEQVTD